MKTYSMVGFDIGIEIQAESVAEAIEIARERYTCGLGGDFRFLDEEDEQEYQENDY